MDDGKQNRPTSSVSVHKNKQSTLDVSLNACGPSTSQPVKQTVVNQTNVPIINSTGVISDTKASKSKPKGNTRKDRTSPAKSDQGKNVEDHLRNNKIDLDKKNRVDSSICSKRTVINSNSNATCKTCNECLISGNHDECVVSFLNHTKVSRVRQVWKETGNKFANVGYQWRSTGRKFTLGNLCILTRTTYPNVKSVKKWRPTGRIFPIESLCPTFRSNASTRTVSSLNPSPYVSLVIHKFVCTNQMDPSCTRGSTYFSYPPLSGFKCRSYKSPLVFGFRLL